MSFKVLGDFPSHYMIQHPDGSSFPVAKKGISEEMHKKIKAFSSPVKMADGGLVPDSNDGGLFSPSAMTAMAQPSRLTPDQLAQIDMDKKAQESASTPWGTQPTGSVFTPTPAPHGVSGSWETDPSAPPANPVQPSNVSYSPASQSGLGAGNPDAGVPRGAQNLFNPGGTNPGPAKTPTDDPFAQFAGYKEGVQGIQGMAASSARAAQQTAKIMDQSIKDQEQMHAEYQNQLKNVTTKIDQVSNDVLNGKVDPNRVWSSMGTGNKVLASISLLLGGVGAGITGKSNAALDVINKSIDNDVEAQKADLNNKNSLLGHYMQQYHNVEAAEGATRLHLATIASSQIQKIAAQQGGAQANSAALLAKSQLMEKYAPLVKEQALYGLKSAMSGGGGEGGLPLELEQKAYPLLSSGDKEYAARRVIVNGRVYQHTGAGSDAEKMRVFEAKLSPITVAVQELDKLGPSAAIPGTKAFETAHSIRAGLATNIAGLKSQEIGSSKINGEEAERALEQINDPSSFKQLMNGGIRNLEFLKDLSRTAESVRKQSLVGYGGRPQTVEYGKR